MTDQSTSAVGAIRPIRLAFLLLASLLAGLVADWMRMDQRLVFPRPLPEFTTTPSPK